MAEHCKKCQIRMQDKLHAGQYSHFPCGEAFSIPAFGEVAQTPPPDGVLCSGPNGHCCGACKQPSDPWQQGQAMSPLPCYLWPAHHEQLVYLVRAIGALWASIRAQRSCHPSWQQLWDLPTPAWLQHQHRQWSSQKQLLQWACWLVSWTMCTLSLRQIGILGKICRLV